MQLSSSDCIKLGIKDDIKLGSDELSYALKMVWGWLQMAVISLATKMASSWGEM
jgi:hypothetical protein